MSGLQDALETLAGVMGAASGAPGVAGTVARVGSAAFSAAAAIAKSGGSPDVEILRILSADPFVSKVHAEWKAELDIKFGGQL